MRCKFAMSLMMDIKNRIDTKRMTNDEMELAIQAIAVLNDLVKKYSVKEEQEIQTPVIY